MANETKPVAPEVDLDELARAVEHSACIDANQWAYSDIVTHLSPNMLRALIAETRALRAVAEAALAWHAVPEDTGAVELALDNACELLLAKRSRP